MIFRAGFVYFQTLQKLPFARALDRSRLGDDLVSKGGGLALQREYFALRSLTFKLLGSAVSPILALREHAVHETCEVSGHGLDRFAGSESGAQRSVTGSQ